MSETEGTSFTVIAEMHKDENLSDRGRIKDEEFERLSKNSTEKLILSCGHGKPKTPGAMPDFP